jgi:glycosyltransferase involved in cell wall biosynthesis
MTATPGKIAIFISFSGQGGVERMINNLAQGFLDHGLAVDMVIAREKGAHLSSIPVGVRQIRLGTNHTLTALPGLIRYLRSETPDVLLAVKDRAIKTAVLARSLSGSHIRLAGRLGTTVSAALKGRGFFRRWLWYTGMKKFYSRVDKLVAVSRGVADDILSITGLPPERVCVIPNPVVTPLMYRMASDTVPHPWLLASEIPVIMGAGRLTAQKDFPTLLRAFAAYREMGAGRLIILGEGESRGELESLASTLGISDSIHMPGFVENPYAWLARCSLFVLSSLWEGSPNVLTEALALGVPVVSTDCPSGPREILENGRYGQLVPMGDETALARAMALTLDTPPAADLLTRAAERFSLKNSVKEYLTAFENAAS